MCKNHVKSRMTNNYAFSCNVLDNPRPYHTLRWYYVSCIHFIQTPRTHKTDRKNKSNQQQEVSSLSKRTQAHLKPGDGYNNHIQVNSTQSLKFLKKTGNQIRKTVMVGTKKTVQETWFYVRVYVSFKVWFNERQTQRWVGVGEDVSSRQGQKQQERDRIR